MKYVPLFLLLLNVVIQEKSTAQHEPTGSWRVISVNLNDQFIYDQATENDLMLIAEGLKMSILNLQKNGSAEFVTRVPQLMVRNARWFFEEETGRIILKDRKSEAVKLSLLFQNAVKPMFYMEESPFIMYVEKIN